MATRIIRTDEDPLLRKVSREVTEFNRRVHVLLDDMIETMAAAEGVGLAAPQVGVLKRVIITDVGEGVVEYINPEILETSGEQCGIEGCLSLPEQSGEVIRPEKLKVRAQNRDGDVFEMEAEGLLARVICHEVDHLNGILFTDIMLPKENDSATEEGPDQPEEADSGMAGSQ